MQLNPGPHTLASVRTIFRPDSSATLKANSPNFYQELDEEFGDFKNHILVAEYSFKSAWPT